MADKIPEKPREIHRPAAPVVYVPKGNVSSGNTPQKSFQGYMDQVRDGGQQTRSTDAPPKPVTSHDEHREGTKDESYKKNREHEMERDEKGNIRNSRDGDSGLHAKLAEKKVMARHALSQGGHQGQDKGSGKGGHQSGREQPKNFAGLLRSKAVSGQEKLGKADKAVATFSLTTLKKMELANEQLQVMPKGLSKQAMDQIVQYVRLMTRVDGQKEMEISLHEKVFQGLKLRVTLIQGKIEATFLTQSVDVQKFFQSQTGEIREALSKKGIAINGLSVKMNA